MLRLLPGALDTSRLAWLLTLLFALSPAGSPARAETAARPNVLLLTVDDMNCDSVGAFGCPVKNITPHIDQLAAEGLRFEHGHVTIAICQPTRAVWMTGRYPHRSGALGFDPIRPDVPTLLEALKQAGYFTGILAKVPHVVPTRQAAWDVIVPANELKTGRDPQRYGKHSADFFRQARDAGKPFFLMANSQDPHRPFAGSDQQRARMRPRGNPRRGRGAGGGFPGVSRTVQPEEVPVPDFLPDLPEVRREIAEYFTSVHRADEIVGAVLKALEEAGLARNTIVMFVSDHGMPLPFAKTNCWFHSTRTPWIVRWPGVIEPGGVDRHHMVSGIDLAPTLLEAAGLPPLPGADGRSFLPVLRGERQEDRDYVFTHINRTAGRNEYPMRSIVTRRFAYIFNAWSNGRTVFKNESQSGRTMKAMRQAAEDDPHIAARVRHFLYRTPEEFYDYAQDPAALRNLIGETRYASEIQELREILLREMRATNDPQLQAFHPK